MFGTSPAHDDQEAPPSTTPASAARAATRARVSKARPPLSALVRKLEIRLNKIEIQVNKTGKVVERIARLLKQGRAR